ncbi:hypothetical protein [Actinoplanes sp. NPDC051494]|uniref:hypothetical protein n=1 Tax=Actinoplanes sp. NPDC051494 TaxID=3363907 RepID=UPI0037BDED2E
MLDDVFRVAAGEGSWAGLADYQHNGITSTPLSNPWTISGNASVAASAGCAAQCFRGDDHRTDTVGAIAEVWSN